MKIKTVTEKLYIVEKDGLYLKGFQSKAPAVRFAKSHGLEVRTLVSKKQYIVEN